MERIVLPPEMAKIIAQLTQQAESMAEKLTYVNQAKQLALITFAHGREINPEEWRLSDDGTSLEHIIPAAMAQSQATLKRDLDRRGIKLVPQSDHSTQCTESPEDSQCMTFAASPRSTECPTDGGWARPESRLTQSELTPGIESGPLSKL